MNHKSIHVLLLHKEWQKAHEVYLNIAVCMTGVSWQWQMVTFTSLKKQVCFAARAVNPKKALPRGLRGIASFPYRVLNKHVNSSSKQESA